MEKNNFWTKEDSKFLHGIAIMIMLWHHLYGTPESFPHYISCFGNSNIEIHLAWFGKICVAFYVVLSGYGLCKKASMVTAETKTSLLKCEYKRAVKTWGGFLTTYWMIYFLFVPVGFLFYNVQFDLKQFVLGAFGHAISYNGAWWYIMLYYRFLLFYPLIHLVLAEFDKIFIGKENSLWIIVLLGSVLSFLCTLKLPFVSLLLKKIVGNEIYFLMFVITYILTYYDVFGKLYNIVIKLRGNELLSLCTIICCGIIRDKFVSKANDVGWYEIIIILLVIISILNLIESKNYNMRDSKSYRIIAFVGRYSTYIWLMHSFFYSYYFRSIFELPKYSILIWLFLVSVCLVFAIFLDFLKKKINIGAREILSILLGRLNYSQK